MTAADPRRATAGAPAPAAASATATAGTPGPVSDAVPAPEAVMGGGAFCQSALLLRVVGAVQLAGASAVLLLAPSGGWWMAQAGTAFGLLGATLAFLGGACAADRWLPRAPVLRRTVLAVWGALSAAAAFGALAWAGLAPAETGARALLGAAATGALAALAVLAWREQRERRVDPAAARARLAELQSRIRPHFLFNALNAALALVRVDPDRAERVLEDLAVLFRQAMAETGSAVTLGEEVELARRYLDIEQVRFGDRLRVTWSIEPAARAARVPPLVLQPLVENAVKHGVEPDLDGGEVEVRARCRGGLVELEVINSLPVAASRPGSGMALANVAERLRLLHDLVAQVTAGPERGPGGPRFVARLVLPL